MRAISNEAVVSTLQLLRRGETRKRIALRLNLSKTFVARVARGEIKPRDGRGDSHQVERIKDLQLFTRPYHKCSACGAYVKMPCLKCALITNNHKALQKYYMPPSYEKGDLEE